MDFPNVFLLLVVGIITLIIVRVIYFLYHSRKPLYTRSPGPLSTLIVLGSGIESSLFLYFSCFKFDPAFAQKLVQQSVYPKLDRLSSISEPPFQATGDNI